MSRAALVLLALATPYYILPILLAAERPASLAAHYPQLAIQGLAVFALWAGTSRLASPTEQRMWKDLATAFGCWWLAVLGLTLLPDTNLRPFNEVLYAFYYIFFAFASERLAHRSPETSRGLSRILRWPAMTAFVAGCFAYFVVVPIVLEPETYATKLPSMYYYLTLDIVPAARFLALWHEARSPRWRSIYGALALLACAIIVFDYLESRVYAWELAWRFEAASDFLWLFPFTALTLLARLRDQDFESAPAPTKTRPSAAEQVGWLTLLSALALPMVHYGYYALGALDESSRATREALVFFWMLAVGALALFQNRLREVSRQELEVGHATLSEELAWRKRIEQDRERLILELESKNAEMEQFARTLSHDLKNPLFTLQGFLGVLDQEIAQDVSPRATDALQRARTAATRFRRLLDELLELSEIGRIRPSERPVNLGHLAAEAVRLLDHHRAEREVQIEIDEELPIVLGDSPRLLQALLALLDNAIRYAGTADRNPRVAIGLQEPATGPQAASDTEHRIILYIRDNGYGLEPRYAERIFQPFEQLQPDGEGTGIGLAIVRRIAEIHGGSSWVESSPGEGCTAFLALPEAPPEALLGLSPRPGAPSSSPED